MREAAYRLYLQPSESQEELLRDLLLCRYELARSCGFETYAHRALNGSTMERPEVVRNFINELSEKLRSRADADFAIMTQMKRREGGQGSALAEIWDTPYFTTQLRRQSLEEQANEFLPYFSLGGCMEGLDNLLQALYGVRLENTEMEPGSPGTAISTNCLLCTKAKDCSATYTAISSSALVSLTRTAISLSKGANGCPTVPTRCP